MRILTPAQKYLAKVLTERLREQISQIDDYHRSTSINIIEVTGDQMLLLLDELDNLRTMEKS